MRPLRGSRIAYSTGSPANARAVTAHGSPGSPASTNRPLRVPTSNSVISPSRDRLEDLDAVVRCDRGVLAPVLAVDEHADVLAEEPALVEDPAPDRGLRALQAAQHVEHRRALDRVIRAASSAGL